MHSGMRVGSSSPSFSATDRGSSLSSGTALHNLTNVNPFRLLHLPRPGTLTGREQRKVLSPVNRNTTALLTRFDCQLSYTSVVNHGSRSIAAAKQTSRHPFACADPHFEPFHRRLSSGVSCGSPSTAAIVCGSRAILRPGLPRPTT